MPAIFRITISTLVCAASLRAFSAAPPPEPELVDLAKVDPTILVELRYATANNVAHAELYRAGAPALVRPSVAQRLVLAQNFLREHGGALKIWDAYRPKRAHERLWQLTNKTSFVADPNDGIGSMHTRGVAVDATLVDPSGRELPMPTDFDNFTPAALIVYAGPNMAVRNNLTLLQRAMARAGFYGLRTEWWHFCAEDWAKYQPVDDHDVAAPNLQTEL